MSFSYVLNIVLVAFAFGFVIFWHELGHFLAARWAGVRVEQFAVGMGHAIFSWRKGIGFRPGNTQAEWDRRVDSEIAKREAGLPPNEQDREWSLRERYDVARDLGLGETDYRFNWIPLGGYVKPTGQDDLRPAKEVQGDDPHAFGAKPVGKRMVIISAGVIMNVILAFALYVVLFLHGFNAPPTVIGQVLPGSPAQVAGLKSGDRILSINGHEQQDYTKLRMNLALLRTDEPATVEVLRRDDSRETVQITPAKNQFEYGMAAIGVMPAGTFDAPKAADLIDEPASPETDALPPGSRIVKVAGQDVSNDKDASALSRAANDANGRPVTITIRNEDKTEYTFNVRSTIARRFNDDPTAAKDARSIAGLQPRVRLTGVQHDSAAEKSGLKPGDIVEQLMVVGSNEAWRPLSLSQFMLRLGEAANAGKHIRLTVERDGKTLDPIEVDPTNKLKGDTSRRGIGVSPDIDLGTPVVAAVTPGTGMATAGIEPGDTIVSIDGKSTAAWPDVLATLRAAGGKEVEVAVTGEGGPRTVKLTLNEEDRTALMQLAFEPVFPLVPLIEPRVTTNPLVAARWGYEETKASIFQVYVTLRRLVEGQVPLSNLSGPVGIFNAGRSAASRGTDWLIWFTALISANLAVVNFLPIPIVDGGLFTFLIAEKITGRQPSPRVQTAAQIAGILLLGSLFLFVTYHDILRQWG